MRRHAIALHRLALAFTRGVLSVHGRVRGPRVSVRVPTERVACLCLAHVQVLHIWDGGFVVREEGREAWLAVLPAVRIVVTEAALSVAPLFMAERRVAVAHVGLWVPTVGPRRVHVHERLLRVGTLHVRLRVKARPHHGVIFSLMAAVAFLTPPAWNLWLKSIITVRLAIKVVPRVKHKI